ncbi:hypothetical protein A3D81_02150 [Candidatus Curtissbacteria bacterium RIFCSPHIGHO2_02_FULL_40_17]|uniref:Uncharacterized protein n=4 Tax=Candidatus Curtissiibacteriota TaxID=1752717 RepID=A0A1F5GGY7_9BACT|nr:MAG: hypothetical protein A2693_01595 [Candidatus Curtissbacteria bacterium RIFCSPHIGHO2_01_FULL_40_12]OGD91089.1 MAG: hypothetical protein A3D81_02150 [Candidatus Curtissbacteria bacterium RIFCSPHIGHO2_02_FULL_40_17]OGE05501.1 MAG: hypothetical protein A3F45_03940 [Candidatus Curtissbacteria bacterium RIFCSPHIGHO2_12_FULL_41_17]OGE07097.1 MAG: hypothetical protein A3I53_02760 [Candidatus Curtissbacteria bacterium RIFCSPLOWO2_02_FULL_40_13b]
MTFIYYPTVSAGDTKDLTKILTAIGAGVSGVKEGVTSGKGVDTDYLIIKASASDIDLTEEETYDLIDAIRTDLPINQ